MLALKPGNLTAIDSLVGKQVVVHGLQSKPELNGQLGLAKNFIVESGRYAIEITEGQGAVALKTDNLTVPSRQELNALRIARETERGAAEAAASKERAAAARAARQREKEIEIARKREAREAAFEEKTEEKKEDKKEMSREEKVFFSIRFFSREYSVFLLIMPHHPHPFRCKKLLI